MTDQRILIKFSLPLQISFTSQDEVDAVALGWLKQAIGDTSQLSPQDKTGICVDIGIGVHI